MKMRDVITRLVTPIKEDYRIPMWVSYIAWFFETLFYDWRWARNRLAQLLEGVVE